MPVRDRCSSDSISLWDVGVSLQVLAVVRNRVRIALQVPENIDRLKEPIVADTAVSLKSRCCTRTLSRQEFHDLKNDLHAIRITLHVFHRQQHAGMLDAAAATFSRVTRQVRALHNLVATNGIELPLQHLDNGL